MQIYFVSTQPDVCQELAKGLRKKGHNCLLFNDLGEIFDALSNVKTPPDLLVYDYYLFNHDIYNIYDDNKANNFYTPLIFYNDPCPIFPELAENWMKLIKMTTTKNFTIKEEEYMPVFKALEKNVNALIRPERTDSKKNTVFYRRILIIKDETKMRASLFCLLETFCLKENTELTLKQIQAIYKKNNKIIKEESLKVELSQLRNYLKRSTSVQAEIIKRNDKYKLVFI